MKTILNVIKEVFKGLQRCAVVGAMTGCKQI